MKVFKNIDWIVQAAMILIVVLAKIFYKEIFSGDGFIYRYFSVGGWQLMSVLVHFFFPGSVKCKARLVYLGLLSLTIGTGIVIGMTGKGDLLGFMYIILFWAPVLALLYLGTSIYEARMIKKRQGV